MSSGLLAAGWWGQLKVRPAPKHQVGADTPDQSATGTWFGLDGPAATEASLTLAETWSQAAQPLLVIAAWTSVAVVLARRSMRWEPRA